jgi:hypothetical protein
MEDWSSDEPSSVLGAAVYVSMMMGWLAGVGLLKFGGGVDGWSPPPIPIPAAKKIYHPIKICSRHNLIHKKYFVFKIFRRQRNKIIMNLQ